MHFTVIYEFFTFECCILLRIYPTGSLWRRQSQQSFNTLTPFYFPSHSLGPPRPPRGFLTFLYMRPLFYGEFVDFTIL
jgi:hypothetical protein